MSRTKLCARWSGTLSQPDHSTPASARAFCSAHAPEAEAIERWEDVVDHDEVDIVWIGATPYMHHDVTDFALNCGKHVFCQARMAATRAEAERMWEAAQRYPERVTALCPPPHGMKNGLYLQKLLAEGAIGTPYHALLHSYNDAWINPEAPLHWRQDAIISGIHIMTLGIYVEVLQRWFGNIKQVQARGRIVIPQRPNGSVEIPDLLHVNAGFSSGLEAALLFSGVASHAPGDKLRVFGSHGSLSYEFTTDEIIIGTTNSSPTQVQVPTSYQRQWTVEQDFIHAVRHPSEPRPKPDFTEGTLYMRVVDAVNRALHGGGTETCI
jgi:predicted dehydrogenase